MGNMSSNNDKKTVNGLNILAIGDEGCGKTSLNITFVKKTFPEDIHQVPYDEWTNILAEVKLEDKAVRVFLSELPSQEHYSRIRTMSYKHMDVVLMCFSVVNPEHLTSIAEKWLPEMKEYIPDIPIVLVGTKSDLKCDEKVISELEARSQKPVSNQEALAFCEKIKAFGFVECSAKTSEGVQEVYRAAVKAVVGV